MTFLEIQHLLAEIGKSVEIMKLCGRFKASVTACEDTCELMLLLWRGYF